MHLHILGICGTFMGGIASLARQAGHRVTGCDQSVYPPMSQQLEALGIELIEGYDAGQIRLAPDVFLIGNALSRGNPLIEAILDAGLPFASGPQWLSEHLLPDYDVLAVAGTHGKTTTSSMLAWILEQAGRQPGFLIGGVPHDFPVSARLSSSPVTRRLPAGQRPPFVIEADEYDTAFFDKRSKFVHYRPRVAVLNNLEFDHADIFPDLAAIETQFHHLVRSVPATGRLIVPHDSDALQRVLARGLWTPVTWMSARQHWWASAGEDDAVLVIHEGARVLGETRWTQLGAHNRRNALAALLASAAVGVPIDIGLAALARFRGVRRRMETIAELGGITLYDDFAHHPTAIATTLQGLRQRAPQGRVLVVLEPRSNTMKSGVWSAALAPSLIEADHTFCYVAGLGWDVAAALASLGNRASCHDSLEQLIAAVQQAVQPGDRVVIMSNGGFGGIHDRLVAALSAAA